MPVNTAQQRLAVAAITKFEKGAVDGQSDPHIEAKYWRKNGLFVHNSHGSALQWQAVTARQTTSGFDRQTQSTFTPTNRLIELTLSNGGYSAVGQVHQTDLWMCKGEQMLIDLLKHEMEWIPEVLWRSLIQDYYKDGTNTTNSANPITGLPGAVKASGSYGGIAYADEGTFFGSGLNVLSGGIYDNFSNDPVPCLTAMVLAGEVGSDAGDSSMTPDAIWLSYADWASVHNALQAQGLGELGASKYRTGAKELEFMGVPIFRSRFLTAGTVWVTNSKFMDWRSPAPKTINTFQREEPSPWSIILLMVFFGLFRVQLPRAFVTATVA